MGVLVGTPLHYRTGGTCLPSITLADNPPDYDTVDLATITVNLGTIIFTNQLNVARDFDTPPDSNDTWHYATDCPDA